MKIEAYKKLESLFNRISLISESISVLHWDAATKMPKRGAHARSGQIAELKKISHDLLVNKETEALLNEALSNTDDLSLWQKANIREMHAQWKKEKIIPKEIVVTLSHACSKCETVWREAKCNNDFSLVKPYLQEVLNLMIEIGQLKAEALNVPLYGALLNDYEPGFDCVHIDKLFTMYANFLPEFLGEVLEHQKMSPKIITPSGPFLIDRSEYVLGEKIFVNVGNLPENIKGEIRFEKIFNSTHNHKYKALKFDSSKPQSNFYLSIYPSIPKGFCTSESLVGEWEVIFDGTPFEKLKFKIIDKMIPGMENQFRPLC